MIKPIRGVPVNPPPIITEPRSVLIQSFVTTSPTTPSLVSYPIIGGGFTPT